MIRFNHTFVKCYYISSSKGLEQVIINCWKEFHDLFTLIRVKLKLKEDRISSNLWRDMYLKKFIFGNRLESDSDVSQYMRQFGILTISIAYMRPRNFISSSNDKFLKLFLLEPAWFVAGMITIWIQVHWKKSYEIAKFIKHFKTL